MRVCALFESSVRKHAFPCMFVHCIDAERMIEGNVTRIPLVITDGFSPLPASVRFRSHRPVCAFPCARSAARIPIRASSRRESRKKFPRFDPSDLIRTFRAHPATAIIIGRDVTSYSLVAKGAGLDRQFEPRLTAGCVCAAAPLWCGPRVLFPNRRGQHRRCANRPFGAAAQ